MKTVQFIDLTDEKDIVIAVKVFGKLEPYTGAKLRADLEELEMLRNSINKTSKASSDVLSPAGTEVAKQSESGPFGSISAKVRHATKRAEKVGRQILLEDDQRALIKALDAAREPWGLPSTSTLAAKLTAIGEKSGHMPELKGSIQKFLERYPILK